jgi:hypothetical protein
LNRINAAAPARVFGLAITVVLVAALLAGALAEGGMAPVAEGLTGGSCRASWRFMHLPGRAGLSGLAVISRKEANDVWVVGRQVEHWNGKAWQVTPFVIHPDTDPADQGLLAVSGAAIDDVWAVGDRRNYGSAGAVFSLTEHWDGKGWSLVQNRGGDTLYGVAAVAKDDVWVSGNSAFRHWDGASWKKFAYPSAAFAMGTISALSRKDVWAVGFDQSAGTPIVAHYTCSG